MNLLLPSTNTDTPYHIATNNDNSREGDSNTGHDANKKHNKGSISLYHQNKKDENWKKTDKEHHRNSKRRQQTNSREPKEVNGIK